MNYLIRLIIICLITSCNSLHKKNPLTEVKDFNLKVQIPDTLKQNDTIYYAPVFINNKAYRLQEALYDYNITDTTTIDTSLSIIINKGIHLMIHNDTAKYWITTGQNPGNYKSPEIIFIAKGPDNHLYYQKYSFNYLVK